MCNIVLINKIRTFYDNDENIYEIWKKQNNNYFLTVTNKLIYKKEIAKTKAEIVETLKILYKNKRFSNNPILQFAEYQY